MYFMDLRISLWMSIIPIRLSQRSRPYLTCSQYSFHRLFLRNSPVFAESETIMLVSLHLSASELDDESFQIFKKSRICSLLFLSSSCLPISFIGKSSARHWVVITVCDPPPAAASSIELCVCRVCAWMRVKQVSTSWLSSRKINWSIDSRSLISLNHYWSIHTQSMGAISPLELIDTRQLWSDDG